jgi:ElaB/YqjD/DUF883 family membrane-anchored ribosome-binding protein
MDIRIDETAAEPRTVDEARNAVERSRQRISSTLDQLEDRIVEKKHELQDKADVLRPLREQIAQRPFTALAVGVGVGALLGSLGGSDDEPEHRHTRSGRIRGTSLSDDDRRGLREWRSARKDRLRAAAKRNRHHRDDSSDDSGSSRFDGLKHQLIGALTSAVTTAVTQRVRSMAMGGVGGLLGGDADDRPSRSGRSSRGERHDAALDRDPRY